MARTSNQLSISEEILLWELNSVANERLLYKDWTGAWTWLVVWSWLSIVWSDLTVPGAEDTTFLNQAYIDRDSTWLVSWWVLSDWWWIVINIASWTWYITKTDGSIRVKVTFSWTTVNASNAWTSYIWIDQSWTAFSFSSKPDTEEYIYLWHVFTNVWNSDIVEIFSIPEYAWDFATRVNHLIANW
jgi:hypothetical protein